MGLDWIAGFLELIGLWTVGSKNRKGFLLYIAGDICWIAFVIATRSAYGLLVIVLPALVINTRNFILWKPGSKHEYDRLTQKDTIIR